MVADMFCILAVFVYEDIGDTGSPCASMSTPLFFHPTLSNPIGKVQNLTAVANRSGSTTALLQNRFITVADFLPRLSFSMVSRLSLT